MRRACRTALIGATSTATSIMVLTAAMTAVAPVTAGAASAAGCGFLGLQTCPTDPAARTPGTPVAQVTQVNQSSGGGTNTKVGTVASTKQIGVPNAGVVPVIGKVGAKADDGAYVLYESRLDARTLDLMVSSPAVGGPVPVRVQLPPTWSSTPTATYPVLYLLHGGDEKADYQSWSLYSGEQAFTAKANALVVMPSTGDAAYASNYFNFGLHGADQYDTFVATELPQLLQRGYRADTRAAIAGLSSGGNSALTVAGQHPGQYGAAASYSGLDDTQLPVIAQTIEFGPILGFKAPAAMWGDPLLNLWIWDDHNPAAHPERLMGMKIFVSSGNGQAGPYDPAGSTDVAFEPLTLTSTQSFLSHAKAAGIPVTADLYGPGEHRWAYWSRELQRSWPLLAAGMGLSP